MKLDRWHGTSSTADVQEKIIGEDTLRHIYTLNLALEAANAVIRLRTPARGLRVDLAGN